MRAERRRPRTPRVTPAAGPPPLPLRHPATLLVALALAVCALISVSYPIFDPDVWQHLLVGKVIWATHAVPRRHLWSWTTWGEPEVLPSWLFRALVWPFWAAGGPLGLFVWRWAGTLATLGIAWAASRRMGARGLAPLVALALAARILAARSQVRPETLVDPLLALELWILETRRNGGADRSPALIAIAILWANAHLSWFLGLLVPIAYLCDEALRGRHSAAAPRRFPLAIVIAIATAATLLNPFGWSGLTQPFEYALSTRNEPLFRTISELEPPALAELWRTPFGWFLIAWILLAARRARRAGVDIAELLIGLVVTAMALQSRRFAGFFAVAGAPFLARDLDAWVPAWPRPSWSARPWSRAVVAAAACALLALPSPGESGEGIGARIAWRAYPVGACDFIAAHGVRGRAFNQYDLGGYLLWRFYPDRGRLPFMDIHQSGTREDRDLYAASGLDSTAWHTLDDHRHFEWALFRRLTEWPDHRMDFLEADSSWALVFADDGSALFVRRGGERPGLADSLAYRYLPVGAAHLRGLGAACVADPALRANVERELSRCIAESEYNASAHSLLATLRMIDQRWDDARAELERALQRDPGVGLAHARLAQIALIQGDFPRALAEVGRERRMPRPAPGVEALAARACAGLGRVQDARGWYRRAIARDPSDQDSRDSLAVLEARDAR